MQLINLLELPARTTVLGVFGCLAGAFLIGCQKEDSAKSDAAGNGEGPTEESISHPKHFHASPTEIRKSAEPEWNQLHFDAVLPDPFSELTVENSPTGFSVNFEAVPPPDGALTTTPREPQESGLKLLAYGIEFPSEKRSQKVALLDAKTGEPFPQQEWNELNKGPVFPDRMAVDSTDQGPRMRLVFAAQKWRHEKFQSPVRIYDRQTHRLISRKPRSEGYRVKFYGDAPSPEDWLILVTVDLDCWHQSPLRVTGSLWGDAIEVEVPMTPGSQVTVGQAQFQLGLLESGDSPAFDTAEDSKSSSDEVLIHPTSGEQYAKSAHEKLAILGYRLITNHDVDLHRTQYHIGYSESEKLGGLHDIEPTGGQFALFRFEPTLYEEYVETTTELWRFRPAAFPLIGIKVQESPGIRTRLDIEKPLGLLPVPASGNLFDVEIPYLKFYARHGGLAPIEVAARAVQFDLETGALGDEIKGKSLEYESITPRGLIEDFIERTGRKVIVDPGNQSIIVE